MKSFEGRLAVVTGGGTGMGRELVVQLAAAGASVAACDLHLDSLEETAGIARAVAHDGAKISTHACDVSDAAQMDRFRDEVVEQHETEHVNLVFNNAGIAGGGSFLNTSRDEWERTFGVCWGGVYNGARSFLPLLVASDEGCIVNTSSVNGFWASLGPGVPHTAYSSAKFAVKGFTEALMEDLRLNAPHVKAAVVMPGHVGTDIVINSRKVHARAEPSSEDDALRLIREGMEQRGMSTEGMTDDQLRELSEMFGVMFREAAPMTAAKAATVILDGVREGRWRILVGDDAVALDQAVRADPEGVYGPDGPSLATIIGS